MNENAEAQGEPITADCDILPPEEQNAPESALKLRNGQSCEPWSPERAQAKEEIKLAFISGKSTLASLAERYLIPYKTLQYWSSDEGWGDLKRSLAEKTAARVGENLVEWMAKRQEAQVKRALVRSETIQGISEEAIANARKSESGILPSDVQAIAVAEDRADQIARRNLGMEDKVGGGMSFNVNFIGSANFT